MSETFSIKTPADFDQIINLILNNYGTYDSLVIALKGDLGAGKTTFVKQLAGKLGVKEMVNSPTFNILKAYSTDHPTYKKLIHIDAYRLEDKNEVDPINLVEEINQPDSLVCIEWPERISHILDMNLIKLDISIMDDENRRVVVTGF